MSFSPETEKLVEQLIQSECLNAVVNYGEKFNSLHEGYAVLLEEVEEVEPNICHLKENTSDFWKYIKKDEWSVIKLKCVENSLYYVNNAIKELAQVGAVLQKIKNTLDVENDNRSKKCSKDCAYLHRHYDKWTCWGQKNTPYVELGDECPYQDEVEE